MDKYQGIYKVEVRLTDKSNYSFYTRTLSQSKDINEKSYSKKSFEIDAAKSNTEMSYNSYEDNNEISYQNGYNYYNDELLYQRYSPQRDTDFSITENNKNKAYNEKLPLYMIRENSYEYEDTPVVYKPVKKREKNRFFGIMLRVFISAALLFGFFGMSKIDNPYCKKATNFIREAIIYDLDANQKKDLGEIKAVTLIEEMQAENNGDED